MPILVLVLSSPILTHCCDETQSLINCWLIDSKRVSVVEKVPPEVERMLWNLNSTSLDLLTSNIWNNIQHKQDSFFQHQYHLNHHFKKVGPFENWSTKYFFRLGIMALLKTKEVFVLTHANFLAISNQES